MTETEAYPNDETLAAIDIAMQTFDVLVCPHTRKRYRLRITNDRAGHDQLIRDLKASGKPVVACFEVTGKLLMLCLRTDFKAISLREDGFKAFPQGLPFEAGQGYFDYA